MDGDDWQGGYDWSEPIKPAFGIGLADYLAAGGKLDESDCEREEKPASTNKDDRNKDHSHNSHHHHGHHHRHRSHSKDKKSKKNKKGEERTKEYTLSEVIAAISRVQDSKQPGKEPEKRKSRIKIESFFADDFNTAGEWYFDVTPDKDNLRYGEPDPDDVPKGWRLPRSGIQCLGLPDGVCARSKLGDPRTTELFIPHIDTTVSKAPERYWYRRRNAVYRDIKVRPNKELSEEIENCKDFIQVDGGWRQRMLDQQRAADDEADPTQSLLRKTAELRQKLHVFPNDADLWIAYANLPDKYIKSSTDRRSLARKMDIYQEALSKNPQSEKLFLEYLEVCRSAWVPEQIDALWTRVIDNQGTARAPQMTIHMWRKYLRFSVGEIDHFSMDKVRSAYKRAIEMLSNSKELFPAISYADCERFLVEAFYELCCFEAKAGFRELALAMMQGLCEFNFYAPKGCPSDKLRAEFSRFWSSEVPRIGEEGSAGWCSWFKGNGNSTEEPPRKKKRKKGPDEERVGMLSEESANFWGSKEAVEEAADEFLKELLGEQYSSEQAKRYDDEDESDSELSDSDEDEFEEDEEEEEEENENEEEEEEEYDPNDSESDSGDYGEVIPNKAIPLRDLTKGEEKEFREDVVKWANAEMEMDRTEWKPMRSYNMVSGKEDQYIQSVILSDDIEDTLFFVQTPENRLLLAYKFLELLGVSPPRRSATSSTEHTFRCTMVEAESADKICLPIKGDRPNKDLSATWLCEGEWEGYFSEGFGVFSIAQTEDSDLWAFSERLLSQLSSLFPGEPQIADTWLAYVARRNSGSKAVWHNLAKGLLEKYRTCLPLWHRYAQCEMVQGNAKNAGRVFKIALDSCNNDTDKSGKLEIAFAYARMLLSQGKKEREIFEVLTKVVGVVPAAGSELSLTPTENVRTKKAYDNLMRDSACYPYALGCAGVLTFVMHGVEEMRRVMEAAIVEAESEGSGIAPLQRERGMEVYVSLCWWYAASPPPGLLPPPPRDLRAVLFSAVFRYPENPYFLSLLLSAPMTLRVKSFLELVISENKERAAFLSWLSARRAQDDAFAIRLCSKMVVPGGPGRHCGALWEELAQRNLRAGNPRDAKRALLNIISAVPWDKHVLLRCLANEDLLALLSVQDIRGIMDLFGDKGLRIRQKLI